MIVAGERRRRCTPAATPACCSRAATAARPGSSTGRCGEHRVDEDWQPGGGGLCLHSIVPWPGEPDRLALAVSAAGVWLTEDHGETWRRGNRGIVPRYLPEEAREDTIQLCVHRMERAAARPERMFIQFHGGVYRSDDAGQTLDRRSATACRPTSASRSRSTRATPTAPT